MIKAFSIIAALATAVQAVALIMLHLLPTGYNPVRDAVSDYGVGRYRGWFWLLRDPQPACLRPGGCTVLHRPAWVSAREPVLLLPNIGSETGARAS